MSTVRPNSEGVEASVLPSRAQLRVDHQANAERICAEFSALPDGLRAETFDCLADIADEPGELEAEQVEWGSLVFVLVAVVAGVVLLGRDRHLYDTFTQGVLTGAVVCVGFVFSWDFVRSVWLTVRDRRAVRREVV